MKPQFQAPCKLLAPHISNGMWKNWVNSEKAKLSTEHANTEPSYTEFLSCIEGAEIRSVRLNNNPIHERPTSQDRDDDMIRYYSESRRCNINNYNNICGTSPQVAEFGVSTPQPPSSATAAQHKRQF